MNDTEAWRQAYPFESHFFERGRYRMHYIDEGGDSPGEHETILAVHGNPTWSFYYRRIVEHFAPAARVVAVDHVGCGLSDKPQKYDYSLPTHRDNLCELIEALDLRGVTLLAHDWGGAIGLGCAAAMPDRFRRLALLNTGAFPPPYIPKRIAACRVPLLGTAAVRGLNLFAAAAITMAVARQPLAPAAKAGLLAPYGNWHDRVAIDRFVQDIPMSSRHPTAAVLRQLESDLPRLGHLPVLLVWGMRDWCFRPECLERFEQIWPHARSVRLDDVGHYVMEDAPDEVITALEAFLRET